MKLNSMMLAVSLGLCAFAAGAQTMDPVPQQGSSYPRFQLYPPVDRGLEVTTRSERIRALAQFEQARVLVPHHPEVVLHLSRVYRRFEGPTRVQAVLQPAVPVGPPAFRLVSTEKRQAGWSPKADLAYGFADQAYTASAHGDHVEAVGAARQAVVQAPQKLAYRLLLVHELAEIGQFEEADAVAFRALSGPAEVGFEDDFDVEVELVKRHKQVRQRIALKHFEAANQAAAAGEGGAAIASARQGVSYAPRQLAHRLQLLSLLLAARQWSEADQGASEAMQVLGAPPALLVLRAHALQRSGQRPAASVYLEAALDAPDLSASEAQQLRLIASDAALAAGEPQKALDLLAPLATATATELAPLDEGVRQRLTLAQQALLRGDSLPAPWSMPKVVCAGKAFSPQCELWPGDKEIDLELPVESSVESPVLALRNVKINFVTSLAQG